MSDPTLAGVRLEVLALRAIVVRLLQHGPVAGAVIKSELTGGGNFWPADASTTGQPPVAAMRQEIERILTEAFGSKGP